MGELIGIHKPTPLFLLYLPLCLSCCIVDDKPLAIDLLHAYAAKVPFLAIVYTTTNPLEALSFVHEAISRSSAPLIVNAPVEPTRNYLFVKTEARLVKVDFGNLLYVESKQNYCMLYTTDA